MFVCSKGDDVIKSYEEECRSSLDVSRSNTDLQLFSFFYSRFFEKKSSNHCYGFILNKNIVVISNTVLQPKF